MGMLANGADVDVRVVALIEERGREVGEFLQQELGDNLRNSVVVCATSDRSAMERARGGLRRDRAWRYFRDQGMRVLFRWTPSHAIRACAARKSAWRPVSRRRSAAPPSVFAVLPRLLERAGMNERPGR